MYGHVYSPCPTFLTALIWRRMSWGIILAKKYLKVEFANARTAETAPLA
jgi:hypothetical protein